MGPEGAPPDSPTALRQPDGDRASHVFGGGPAHARAWVTKFDFHWDLCPSPLSPSASVEARSRPTACGHQGSRAARCPASAGFPVSSRPRWSISQLSGAEIWGTESGRSGTVLETRQTLRQFNLIIRTQCMYFVHLSSLVPSDCFKTESKSTYLEVHAFGAPGWLRRMCNS